MAKIPDGRGPPDKGMRVDVRHDVIGDHTTIAVQLPGCASAAEADAMRRQVEYQLHRFQADFMGSRMMGVSGYSAAEYIQRAEAANAKARYLSQQEMLMQSPYGQKALQLAGVQSAQPKPKKYARKKLLLCEVKNAV